MLNKRPKKRIYIILLIFSIIISVSISLIIRSSINPYNLEVIQEGSLKGTTQVNIFYHDFDKDNISETITTDNNEKTNRHFIFVKNYSGDLIDQLNYFESTSILKRQVRILFDDYNADDLDDVFTFTHAGDSLFLYIHDLHLKKVVLNRHFLFKVQPPYIFANKPFKVIGSSLIDINGEGKKYLVFAVCSGPSIRPRGVYIFDIEKQIIIKRFESDAYINNIFLYDLTGDGKEEIIVTSNAVGNVHYTSEYSDQKCWLFVLDQNLKYIFEPLSFGEYRSNLFCYPVEIESKRFLLLAHKFSGSKNIADAVFFINSKGKILPEKKFEFSSRSSLFNPLLIDKSGSDVRIYTWQEERKIVMLDKELNIKSKILTEFDGIAPFAIKDLNNDGENELICLTNDNLIVLGKDLELLASIQEPVRPITIITFRENGKGKPIDIGFNSGDKFFLYSMRKNYVYSYLPLITVGTSLFIFIILIILFLMLSRLYTFSKYHRFSLVNSFEGAMMLDYAGSIKYFNKKAQTLLKFNSELNIGKYFDVELKKIPCLVDIIKKRLNKNEVFTEWISIPNGTSIIDVKVSVTPIHSKFNLLRSYLVEFQDLDDSVVTNKLFLWSKAAQRMVHDIKYPLSVAAVKLDTLKTRISALPLEVNDNINNDFETISSEIKRVNSIAKSFLKFSDLEKPNFQVVSVKNIINNCIERYEGFIDDNLKIQIVIDDNVEDIWADEQQIELVLHNLVENSIDAIKGKGSIIISASLAQYLDNSLAEVVEIEVADTGPGIDDNIREKIFQPHTTTKTGGTGIGLAIAKKIVEDHQGEIGFYSKENFGTVVRFSIKVQKKL